MPFVRLLIYIFRENVRIIVIGFYKFNFDNSIFIKNIEILATNNYGDLTSCGKSRFPQTPF